MATSTGTAIVAAGVDLPEWARRATNLADPRIGAAAICASDEFFAPLARMLDPRPAMFVPGKYDANGKWMDGWETRRKRTTGHDWCIVKLARPGIVKGVDLDTSHFTGNFPPAASIEATCTEGEPGSSSEWVEILPSVALSGNAHHYHAIEANRPFTHLRINLYPDGGLARLRVYGQPQVDWSRLANADTVNLAAMENGAYVV